MGLLRMSEWQKLPVSLKELCIDTTLQCGQSFRWRKSEDNIWSCALHGRILSLRQDSEFLHYRAIFPERNEAPLTPPSSVAPSTVDAGPNDDDTKSLISHYFNLETNLTELYEQWAQDDPNFKKKAPRFTGVRILKQDSWEALAGFICSTNNNIKRISQMVEKLCVNYGPLIGHVDSQSFYDFPEPEALTGPRVEQHLRELGFGYRAKYIHKTAQIVAEKESGWLDSLRNPESARFAKDRQSAGEFVQEGREGYRIAHEQLLELQGVGPKVADCVCLFGLGWGESVPVDTHVWQIAQRDYKFGKSKHMSMTKATYDAIANHFRKLWGKEAGWAHSVLFTADLKTFSGRIVAKTEVKEEAELVKVEDNGDVKLEHVVETTTTTEESKVKRALALEERSVLKVERSEVKSSKRRRAK